MANITPFVGCIMQFDEKVYDEDYANPELKRHVTVILQEIDSFKGVE